MPSHRLFIPRLDALYPLFFPLWQAFPGKYEIQKRTEQRQKNNRYDPGDFVRGIAVHVDDMYDDHQRQEETDGIIQCEFFPEKQHGIYDGNNLRRQKKLNHEHPAEQDSFKILHTLPQADGTIRKRRSSVL
jgi:hypothetical protein